MKDRSGIQVANDFQRATFMRLYWPDDSLNWPDDRLSDADLRSLYAHWTMFGMAACPRICPLCFRSR